MFNEAIGSLFKAERKRPEVREGGVFRHTGPGDLVETAEVLHVGPDPMGIPHVHYRVIVGGSARRASDIETSRTLNLDTFTNYFGEAVEA
jgi:hypothetical protein